MVGITYVSQMEAVVQTDNDYETGIIENHFKKKVPNSEWIVRRRGGFGCFHYRFYSVQTERLGRGLLPELKALLKERGIPYSIDKNNFEDKGEQIAPSQILDWSRSILNDKFTLRDDQADNIAKCLCRKQLICQLPTAYGKSMVIYGVCRKLIECSDRTILIIVPKKQLVSQLLDDFKNYGWDNAAEYAEVLHGDLKGKERPTFKKRILISTWQSLYKNSIFFFEKYKALIIDEVHKAQAESLYKLARKCANADYRLGFTGTMPKDEHDSFMVQCHLGPVYAPSSYEDMKEMGILSDCCVKMIKLDYPDEVRDRWCRRGFRDEIAFIENNKERCRKIMEIIDGMPKSENKLVMFNHTKHLDLMKEVFESAGYSNIQVIKGAVKVKSRENIRLSVENEEDSLIFATYGCVQEGINIRKLHHVIFAAPVKSEIRVLQTIGRGLRLHETKDKVVIWDICDDFSQGKLKNHTWKFGGERYEYYVEQKYSVEKEKYKIDCDAVNYEDD